MTDIATLQAEVARLTAERDEMRAQILGMLPADGRDLGAENAKLRALLAEILALPGDDDGKSVAVSIPLDTYRRMAP